MWPLSLQTLHYFLRLLSACSHKGVSLFNAKLVKNLLRLLLYIRHLIKCKHGYHSHWICLKVMTSFRNKGRDEVI